VEVVYGSGSSCSCCSSSGGSIVVAAVAHTVVAAVATVTNEYREPRGHVTLTSKHYDKSPVKPSFQHLPTGLTASKALRRRRRRRCCLHFPSATTDTAPTLLHDEARVNNV